MITQEALDIAISEGKALGEAIRPAMPDAVDALDTLIRTLAEKHSSMPRGGCRGLGKQTPEQQQQEKERDDLWLAITRLGQAMTTGLNL